MEKLLVFIPAYNCEKQVTRVLSQLLDQRIAPWVGECIVVNNRSADGTEAAVQDWMARHPDAPVRLLRNDQNYGLGGSHKVAFGYAAAHGYEHLVVLHGDDQGAIADLLPILNDGTYKKIRLLPWFPLYEGAARPAATARCAPGATTASTGSLA